MKRADDFSKNIMKVLKAQAIARGYTQKGLAKNLRISVPTLKRWLSGQAVTLENLKRMADMLGISFLELAEAVNQYGKNQFQYTQVQEEQLAKDPELLAFFDYLVRGYTPSKIQKKFALSILFVEQSLSRLDKLGLIDWLPQNKARLKIAGEPVWRRDGPLARRFGSQIKTDFINNLNIKFERFAIFDYLPEDKTKIERMLEDILELSRQAGSRAAFGNRGVNSGGLLISFKEFRWDLDKYLEKK